MIGRAGGLLVVGLMLVGFVGGGSGALAQSGPGRVVQAGDGSLYLLKDGARYAIVADPIDDEELAIYADGGTVGASVLLSSELGAGQQGGGPPMADVPLQMPTAEDAPAVPAPQAEPAANAPLTEVEQPATVPATQPACTTAPTGAKRAASCPGPAAAAAPTPAAQGFRFLTVQGNSPGSQATVSVQATPGALCSIGYLTPNGRRGASATSLNQQTAGATGVVSWSFPVDAAALPGTGSVTVTCGGATITSPFNVSGLSK